MDKSHLHHIRANKLHIRPWYFLILAVISSAICVYALRQNNITMIKLRDNVYAADQNNVNVEGALKTLQAYVTSHMNTNLTGNSDAVYPPVQLKYTYERLVAAEEQQLNDSNTQIYTNAQNYCQQVDSTDFSGRNRVPCIEQYVENHGIQLPAIPASLYEFDFISPKWSPDAAGWTLVVSIALFLLFIISWVSQRWLKKKAE